MASSGPIVRSPQEIDFALKTAVEWLPKSNNPQFVRGAIAGYRWVLHRNGAPVSGEALPVTVDTVRHEERLADAAVRGEPGSPEVNPSYADGAHNALLWLRGRDREPPI